MKKFSDLNKENTKVEESTNTVNFIKNLINETLSVEDGQIKGIDVLTKTLNSVMELNESKTKIKVLEQVKAVSAYSFNFVKINEEIDMEKTIIKNYVLFVSDEEEVEDGIALASVEVVDQAIISESVESVNKNCDCGDDCKCGDKCTCEKVQESVEEIVLESSNGDCREKCIAACKKCIAACKKCIAGCNNKKCGENCVKCCEKCEKCIEACEKCIETCKNKSEKCAEACKKCAEACKKCAEACKKMDMKCCEDCAKCCEDCAKCCEDCAKKDCVTESTEPINESDNVKDVKNIGVCKECKKSKEDCVCEDGFKEDDECDVCEKCECDPCECPEEAKDIEEQEVEVTESVEEVIEEEVVVESFVEKVQFPRDSGLQEIDSLYKLMESINTEEVLNEDHLTSKKDRVDYILDCVGKTSCKKTITDFISKLPSYVKDSDVNKTINQLSSSEVEKLYKACEKCCD